MKLLEDRFSAGRDTPLLPATDARELTHGVFLNDALRLAGSWRDQGLSKGETVAAALCRLTRDSCTIDRIGGQIQQIQRTSAPIPVQLRGRFMDKFSVPLHRRGRIVGHGAV